MSTTASSPYFAPRTSVEQVEEGRQLAPKFAEHGLIPCVTTAADTGEVLMFAYMNDRALSKTIETGQAHYWSRSRGKLWKKGETSGLVQHVQQMLIDDDQDCVVLKVSLDAPTAGGDAASCHVGYRSCFYRAVPTGEAAKNADGPLELGFVEQEKAFDPDAVYGDTPNPTRL